MKRWMILFLVSVGCVFVIFLPLQVFAEEESALQGDKRLTQIVSWQGVNQPVRRALESLSAQLKIPLRAEKGTASLRLTVSGSPRSAHGLMGLIAKTLGAKWQRDEEGYLLIRPAPPRLSQAEQERLHHEFHAREWREIKREADHQTREFMMDLLNSSRLTDEQVVELASHYPLISKVLDKPDGKPTIMCARLVTWLTKDQLKQAFVSNEEDWGVKLTREEVLKTGTDYGLDFTHICIRILPDRELPICGCIFFPNGTGQKIMVVAF